jgi:hypothetical protein
MFEDLLRHSATVLRRMDGLDRFKQKTTAHRQVATGVPCRVSRASGNERNDDKSAGIVTERYTLYCKAGSDITEDDRITVHSSDGVLIVDDACVDHVRAVTGRFGALHHLEVSLEVVRDIR